MFNSECSGVFYDCTTLFWKWLEFTYGPKWLTRSPQSEAYSFSKSIIMAKTTPWLWLPCPLFVVWWSVRLPHQEFSDAFSTTTTTTFDLCLSQGAQDLHTLLHIHDTVHFDLSQVGITQASNKEAHFAYN